MIRKLLFVLSISSFCYGQPVIEWQKSFGGSNADQAKTIIQSSDGGYVFTGTTASSDGDISGAHGLDDIWVVKTDASGEMEWQKTLGGSQYEYAYRVLELTDGYLVCGGTLSWNGDVSQNNGLVDAWLVKLDPDGNLVWEKTIGGNNLDHGLDIKPLPGGGYIMAGASGPTAASPLLDAWFVKLDEQANVVWQKTYGGSQRDAMYSVVLTDDGGFLGGGYTDSADGDVTGSHGNRDSWVIKLDQDGNLQWQKTFGGSGNEGIDNLIRLSDGTYAFTGSTQSNDGDLDGIVLFSAWWTLKFDAEGTILWSRELRSNGGCSGLSLIEANDGSIVTAGRAAMNSPYVYGDFLDCHGDDMAIAGYTASGDLLYKDVYGGTGADLGSMIVQTSDNGFAFCGSSGSSDLDATQNHGDYDMWILKLSPAVLSDSVFTEPLSFMMYPNPSKNLVHLDHETDSYEISDMNGRKILEGKRTSDIDISELTTGLYTLELQTQKGLFKTKVIKN
ncbi:T9SS type A sorting domain-containing protein [Flavobacterium silvaticum]|uniref:T9SS type A sorting domain-containing protein n=1 Tax=Flavobacterium silvaticum TaxID=1852020 RepID=A0A972FMY2_9FLAO|nr:T9SS type A sorting domain-containing protein [Flavobacterium silvaticum]NMH28996.1 T9SS type A sorting domain-containing protein [Flavobacterium silvaticum]